MDQAMENINIDGSSSTNATPLSLLKVPGPYAQNHQHPFSFIPDHSRPNDHPPPSLPKPRDHAHTQMLQSSDHDYFELAFMRNEALCSMQQSPNQSQYIGYMKKVNAKIARHHRMMVRRRMRLRSQGIGTPFSMFRPSPTSSRTRLGKRVSTSSASKNKNIGELEDLFIFSTPDNTKLRVLLEKVLTTSDVSEAGRIVLPKKDAEESLPPLYSREGIAVVMKEMNTNKQWRLKYRFWANHRGRMYVFDHLGNFVLGNNLKCGDSLILYEDKCRNLYFSIRKAACHLPNPQTDMSKAPYILASFRIEAIDKGYLSLKPPATEPDHEETLEDGSLVASEHDDTPSSATSDRDVPITLQFI